VGAPLAVVHKVPFGPATSNDCKKATGASSEIPADLRGTGGCGERSNSGEGKSFTDTGQISVVKEDDEVKGLDVQEGGTSVSGKRMPNLEVLDHVGSGVHLEWNKKIRELPIAGCLLSCCGGGRRGVSQRRGKGSGGKTPVSEGGHVRASQLVGGGKKNFRYKLIQAGIVLPFRDNPRFRNGMW